MPRVVNIMLDISAVLIELCFVAQHLPLIDKAPDPLDFKKVRTRTTKNLSVTIWNIRVGDVGLTNIQVSGGGLATSAATLGSIREGSTAQIPVSFSPAAAGSASGLLTFALQHPDGIITDGTDVQLVATGCIVGKNACAAPVFAPNHWLVCLLMWLIAPVVLEFMAIFSWLPSAQCAIKRYVFRLKKCTSGNESWRQFFRHELKWMNCSILAYESRSHHETIPSQSFPDLQRKGRPAGDPRR